ncbi:MAG: hypothetical protein AB1797_10015 [bacterium]
MSVVPAKRKAENVDKLVKDFKKRTESGLMNLITTDEYPAYKGSILAAYGPKITPPRTEK